MKIDLVVTKNPSFLAYLIKTGIVESTVPWYEYGTPVALIGKHVISDNLPYCLSSIALSYTEVPLHLPKELVGKKLIMTDYEKYADDPVTYSVQCLSEVEVKIQRKEEKFIYFVEFKKTTFQPWMDIEEVS